MNLESKTLALDHQLVTKPWDLINNVIIPPNINYLLANQ